MPSEYKAAWVIDGQHRLYAYANVDESKTAELSVVAFENLNESEQARLFVDINAKQKSVKQNLLVELYAELNWNSDDPDDRVMAIIAKAILSLDADSRSPFFSKIVRADDSVTSNRSISMTALSGALQQPECFLAKTKAGLVPGAFWTTDQMKTLKRAAAVVDAWVARAIAQSRDNWDLGRGPGGALGMNDSVIALLLTLRSVLQALSERGIRLYELTTDELIYEISPYAAELADAFSRYDQNDFALYRSFRGGQGSAPANAGASACFA